MHLSVGRTTWITLIALMALLVSVFASSIILTSSQISDSARSKASIPHTHQHQSTPRPDQMADNSHCDVDTKSEHYCCDSGCINVLAVIPQIDELTSLNGRLALFKMMLSGDAVYRSQSLFRPPIA
ncbi:hypothetical protein [Vibrio mangrovi]|uniref:Uncharacterized protein n=1 Tax=Vibrio mangrovi TaxID=474394 RepID=A0A1Y6IMS8_9VIBR|nr:hypothetical protein [Vibrio mangrovi]MDW6004236.1 hypothetical protein [Vibrio mangrovi]SMR98965.1 hypothetical protein VIM7927_00185 [Vibrio mangrovi]